MNASFLPPQAGPLLTRHLKMGGANPAGIRLDLTNRYLTRAGQPFLPVMGEFHFSRCEAEAWPAELAKMKAGGVTIAATYLFWIHHEEIEGARRFTGNLDIRRFVLDCGRAGLAVVLRIGPWAHGECRNGGFPDWLVRKGIPLRCNDPAYLALVRGWYAAVFAQVQGLLYKDGGPVIGVQLENELVDDAAHLATLKQIAVEAGFDVPYYTVTGWNAAAGARIPADEVLPVFSAYPDAPWAAGTAPLPLSPHYVFDAERNDAAVGADLMARTAPDGWQLPYDRYPFATCELGCGQQSTYHRRVRISPMDAYALSLVKLGSGNNLIGYYMYHGGTNPVGRLSTMQESRATGYPNDYPILNYDFDTALSEYGEARPQYGLLNLLHLFAADFGETLAPMPFAPPAAPARPDDLDALRYAMRTDGTAGFVFVNHHQRHAALRPVRDVRFDTGAVVFPPVTVAGDIAFFFPFGLMLGGVRLAWATAQPICRCGDSFFFAAVPGIPAQYAFEGGLRFTAGPGVTVQDAGGVRVVTLPLAEAVCLRRLGGRVYLGERCNLYLDPGSGALRAIEDGPFAYRLWEDGRFVRRSVHRPFAPAVWTLTPCPAPFSPDKAGAAELALSGAPARWFALAVTTPEGFVTIGAPHDIAQIYADGRLIADEFGTGRPWRVPARLLYGKTCHLALTPPTASVWREPPA